MVNGFLGYIPINQHEILSVWSRSFGPFLLPNQRFLHTLVSLCSVFEIESYGGNF